MKKSKENIYNYVVSFLKNYNASKIAVFGSYANNEESSKSDLDIMVEFKDKITLFDLVGMEQELSEKLGIKVDLITEKSISPCLIDKVREEMKVIYY
jgi:uncharacterized protein